jgi:large subunit ribosomal protein L29
MMKTKELRQFSDEELNQTLAKFKRQNFELQTEYELSHKIERPHRLRENRRTIARILSIKREREINAIKEGVTIA